MGVAEVITAGCSDSASPVFYKGLGAKIGPAPATPAGPALMALFLVKEHVPS